MVHIVAVLIFMEGSDSTYTHTRKVSETVGVVAPQRNSACTQQFTVARTWHGHQPHLTGSMPISLHRSAMASWRCRSLIVSSSRNDGVPAPVRVAGVMATP